MMMASEAKLFIPLNITNGLGAGMIWPAIYALVADLYGREQRGTVPVGQARTARACAAGFDLDCYPLLGRGYEH
jgi:MFS family permease